MIEFQFFLYCHLDIRHVEIRGELDLLPCFYEQVHVLIVIYDIVELANRNTGKSALDLLIVIAGQLIDYGWFQDR